MSHTNTTPPTCSESQGPLALIIEPKYKELGGFTVRRVLPAPSCQMVGPFIFFDHMGPAEFPPGKGISVRPHPHIGLATVTYLFEGEIIHRDNLGYTQPIREGAVNLMTAGRGIAHSERAGDDLHRTSRLHGIQSWMALPDGKEEIEPAFVHYPASKVPEVTEQGVTVRLIIGTAYGQTSPVTVHAPMLYLECLMPAGSALALPADYEELAVYVVEGAISVEGHPLASGLMGVACKGQQLTIQSPGTSRVMVIGGSAPGERHIWWNFVSSSRERIEQAKRDWKSHKFGSVVDDAELIPLPE